MQRPLKLSSEGMRESAIRNATLVEAVQGLEDIKLMRAEQRFQNQWNNTNDVAASVGMKQRWLTGLLLTRPVRCNLSSTPWCCWWGVTWSSAVT